MRSGKHNFNPRSALAQWHLLVRNVRAGEQRDLTDTMRAREPVGMFVSSLRLGRSETRSSSPVLVALAINELARTPRVVESDSGPNPRSCVA